VVKIIIAPVSWVSWKVGIYLGSFSKDLFYNRVKYRLGVEEKHLLPSFRKQEQKLQKVGFSNLQHVLIYIMHALTFTLQHNT
jgi:hypothetical protein